MSTRKPEDPRAPLFRQSRVSQAKLWLTTVRRLIEERPYDFGVLMGVVAGYLCVDYCHKLVTNYGRVYADAVARADCPLTADQLKAHRTRLGNMRDTVLHLSEMTEEGAAWGLDSRRNPDLIETIWTNNPGRGTAETMTKPEIIKLLNTLEPWLERHYDRLVRSA